MTRDALISGIEAAGRRARWMRALLALSLLLSLLSLLNDRALLDFLRHAQSGQPAPQDEGELLDSREALLGLAYIGLFLASAGMWLAWVHRATANLRLAGSCRSRFTPGWAVGWHFVPIMNLWRVPQVMLDLQGRSEDRNEYHVERGQHPGLILTWWTAFLIEHVLGRIVLRSLLSAGSLSELVRAYDLSVKLDAVSLVSTALAWMVVRRIDRLQREVLVLAPPAPALPAPAS